MSNSRRTICKIILFNLCFLGACHASTYVLNQGDALNSSSALVSKNGHFTLRFENGYLGIRYNGDRVTNQPFWIANRAKPISDSSRKLVIDQTGKLKITYNKGASAFELYSGRQSDAQVFAILQDNGNFVLKNKIGDKEQILWRSFDHPTDSFLPGMKLGINNKTGQIWSLTSWLTVSNAAPGAFSLEWNPRERQLILKRREMVFWTSGELSEDNTFENVLLDDGLTDHRFVEVSNENENYLKYEFLANEYTPKKWVNVTWLWLMHTGSILDQNSRRVIVHPDLCDGYSVSSGCRRWHGPKCRRNAVIQRQFWVTRNAKDYLHVNNTNFSLSDCKDICWKNCSCFGTKSHNPDGTGCTFYYESLSGPSTEPRELVYVISQLSSGMSLSYSLHERDLCY